MSLRHLARAFAIAVLGLSPASAHDPGMSSAEWRLGADGLAGTLTFNPADLDGLLDAGSPSAFAAAALDVAFDGEAAAPASVEAQRDGKDNVVIRASFPMHAAKAVRIRLRALERLPRGHRHYAVLKDACGEVLVERLLDARSLDLDAALDGGATDAAGAGAAFWRFLVLGVEHILAGFDHLAFLFAVIVAGGGGWRVAGAVTAFTAAHSLTLALAALGVVRLGPEIVEPLIAASIVYVAIENLVRRETKRRWLLTFAFGLVHGLGFASLLGELLLERGAAGIIAPLAAFNLGVEAGQLGVLALALPGLWLLEKKPAFSRRFAAVASAALGAAGVYWLAERTWL
jgi:hypothetical protein